MRVLIVAATSGEIAPLMAAIDPASQPGSPVTRGSYAGHEIDLLVTGVGVVATAAWCSRIMTQQSYDVAFNLGLCGAFDPTLEPGQVVHVVSDRLPELGAEDGERFLSIHELGLLAPDEFPFQSGAIVNASPPANPALGRLDRVDGVTVSTVHGDDASIAAIVARCHPQVESMEGAAFMYACLINAVSFAQVRAVSNRVERRNRAAWQVGPAIRELGVAGLRLLESR